MLTVGQALIAHAVKVAVLAALLGLVVKRRYALCWSFTIYLVAILAGNSLGTFWPERFYTQRFWILKQGVYDALKFGIALELGTRAFRLFPGALPFVRAAAVAVALLMAAALMALPATQDFAGYSTQLHPRIVNGTIWLMTFVLALALWFRVPLEPLHKAILTGFVPYLFVFSAGQNLVSLTEGRFVPWLNHLDPLAYLAAVCYWAWAAWRQQEEAVPAGHPLAAVAEARG